MNKWRNSLISWCSRTINNNNPFISVGFYYLLMLPTLIIIGLMWLCIMVDSIPEYMTHKRELRRERIREEENRIWEQQLIESLRHNNTFDFGALPGTYNDIGITVAQAENSMRDLAMLQSYWSPPTIIVDDSIVKYKIKKHELKRYE